MPYNMHLQSEIIPRSYIRASQLEKIKAFIKDECDLNKPLNFTDKVELRKRAVIESVNDILNNVCYVEHIRYRSFENVVTNIMFGLIISFLSKKIIY